MVAQRPSPAARSRERSRVPLSFADYRYGRNAKYASPISDKGLGLVSSSRRPNDCGLDKEQRSIYEGSVIGPDCVSGRDGLFEIESGTFPED